MVSWSRRSFVKALSAGAASVFLPTGGRGAALPADPAPERRPESLPPRVVGLRTQGGNFRFDPAGLRLSSGESLVWLNMGDFHTATAFHPDHSELLAQEVPLRIPEGAEPFHSGMLGLSDGTEFEHRFTVPGVYDYFCQPHYSFGMVGRLVVGDGEDADPRPLSELNEASRRRMPSVEAILDERGRTFEWAARINGLLWLRAHDRPADGAFRALAEETAADRALRNVLGSRRKEYRDRVSDFGKALSSGDDYESLVRRADRAKSVLEAVGPLGN